MSPRVPQTPPDTLALAERNLDPDAPLDAPQGRAIGSISAADPLAALPPLQQELGGGGGGSKRKDTRRRKPRPPREGGSILGVAAARILDAIGENSDLIAIFVLVAGAQSAVPVGHVLAQQGLVPWMLMVLAIAATLQGQALGEGPHPALRSRTTSFDILMRRLARASLPLAAGGLYLSTRWLLDPVPGALPPLARLDLGLFQLTVGTDTLKALGLGFGAGFAGLFFRLVSSKDRLTAWNPPGPASALFWIPGILLFILLSLSAGFYDGLLQSALDTRADTGLRPGGLAWAEWVGASLLVGVVFLAVGLIDGSTRNLRQRLAAGQRNGDRWKPARFRLALAFLGPALSLWLLMQGVRALQGQSPGFEQAFVGACHILAWVAVIWPRKAPVAVHCLLSEVRPYSGRDEKGGETALDFDQVPEGALRINPVEMRATRALHPWLIPVKLGRIEDLDDPVRPLWGRPNRPRDHHILGEASFDPHPETRQPQTEVVTLHLRAPEDVTTLSGGDVQSKRIVVLRPYPHGEGRKGQQTVTYRWDDHRLPPGSMQIVDPNTRKLELRDGDVLVLSSEGVARAYVFEIGSPLLEWGPLSTSRPPQVQDYTKL